VAQKFIENGFINVFVLEGGWNEWYKANYPIEEK